MIRAVLDTNVVISGIIKGGAAPGHILAALFEHRFIALTSRAILDEVARVLTYPRIADRYHVTQEAAEAILTSLALLSVLVEVPALSVRASRDPEDDRFLACALQGHADTLVTADKDLLELNPFQGIEIVTAGAFLRLL